MVLGVREYVTFSRRDVLSWVQRPEFPSSAMTSRSPWIELSPGPWGVSIDFGCRSFVSPSHFHP